MFITLGFPIGGWLLLNLFESSIKQDIASARGDLANLSVLLVGDFNLQPADEAKMKIDCPSAQGTFQNITSCFLVHGSLFLTRSLTSSSLKPVRLFLRLVV